MPTASRRISSGSLSEALGISDQLTISEASKETMVSVYQSCATALDEYAGVFDIDPPLRIVRQFGRRPVGGGVTSGREVDDPTGHSNPTSLDGGQ